MKRILVCCILLLSASIVQAQISVSSFSWLNDIYGQAAVSQEVSFSSDIVVDGVWNSQGADAFKFSGNGYSLDGNNLGHFEVMNLMQSVSFENVQIRNFYEIKSSADSNASTLGGFVYATNITSILASIISSNTVYAEVSVSTENTADAAGGAFYTLGDINISSSVFEYNTAYAKALSSSTASGGVFVNRNNNVVNIYNSSFTYNSVIAQSSSETATAYGGAIHNIGTMTVTNSYFAFNKAVSSGTGSAYGGAIHNEGILNLNADGANTVFEGNTSNGASNAIFNSSGGVININTTSGGEVVFNDAITGIGFEENGVINILGGKVVVNNSIRSNDINLQNATLVFGVFDGILVDGSTISYIVNPSRGAFGSGTDYVGKGQLNISGASVIDMANGKVGDVLYISTLTVNGTPKINVDVDLSTLKADMLDVANATLGTGTLDFSGLKILTNFASGITGDVKVLMYEPNVDYLAGTNFSVNSSSADYLVVRGSSTSLNFTLVEYSSDVFQLYVSTKTGNRTFNAFENYDIGENYYSPLKYSGIVSSGTLTINGTDGDNVYSVSGADTNRIFNINDENTILNINGTIIKQGASEFGSAILNSSGSVAITSSIFQNNNAKSTNTVVVAGGAIYNSIYTYIEDSSFISNTVTGDDSLGGAIYNALGSSLTIQGAIFSKNTASGTGSKGGAIYSEGILNLIATDKNIEFAENKSDGISNAIHSADGAVINMYAGNAMIVFNDAITSSGDNNIININAVNVSSLPTNGTVFINADMSGFGNNLTDSGNSVNLYGGTLQLGENAVFFNNTKFNMYAGSTLTVINASINNIASSDFNLADSGESYLGIDVDLRNSIADNFMGSTLATSNGTLVINNINLLNDVSDLNKNVVIQIADDLSFMNALQLSDSVKKVVGPIFVYDVGYNNGLLSFDYTNDFNPSVFIVPVAMQIGGYLELLNSYSQVFYNIEQRMQNKDYKGLWVTPYANSEDVKLSDKLTVTNESYGAYFGYDTVKSDLWSMNISFSIYGAFNGSNQKYDGASIDKIGGMLGGTALLFGEKFYTALTLNIGASSEHGEGPNGTENFMMYTKGIASRTGYNFALSYDEKYKLVPELTMSMSFVDMAPFGNPASVEVTSDNMSPFTLEPSVKLVAEISDDLNTFANVSLVYPVGKTEFKANDIILPELTIDPYVQYGIGIGKKFSDTVVAKAEVFGRSAGRTGFGGNINLHFRLGGLK